MFGSNLENPFLRFGTFSLFLKGPKYQLKQRLSYNKSTTNLDELIQNLIYS